MRILLVEDEQRLARSYARNMQEEGHQVEVVYDGETAYTRVMADPDHLDVIVLDVLLPGWSGLSVCKALRQEGIRTPILLLTALDATEDTVAGLDAGADDYLTKPFPFAELLARLRALARRGRGFEDEAAANQIRVGDLVIDLPRHEVTRDGTVIPLTPREFALLEYLARNANRVLTREQLTTRIWPEGTEAGSNVLDIYIHYLRGKIDTPGRAKILHTVRGIGFSLRTPREGTHSDGS